MKAVLQRVSRARVYVGPDVVGEIGPGIVVLLGIRNGDTDDDVEYLVDKTLNLRIFDDNNGKMNLSLLDGDGGLLVVSQFTLYGDASRGRRPSFIEAARPSEAAVLYESFIEKSRKQLPSVATGKFQAMMEVELVNDGPVTIILESPPKKV